MATKVQLHVDDLAAMGKRFVDAWHRVQAGETVDEAHVTFPSFQAQTQTLSPRRLELLRFMRLHGAANVRELAALLGRDYKNVHQDVSALKSAGLLVREGRRLTAPWTEVRASSYGNVQPLARFFADLLSEQRETPLPQPKGR